MNYLCPLIVSLLWIQNTTAQGIPEMLGNWNGDKTVKITMGDYKTTYDVTFQCAFKEDNSFTISTEDIFQNYALEIYKENLGINHLNYKRNGETNNNEIPVMLYSDSDIDENKTKNIQVKILDENHITLKIMDDDDTQFLDLRRSD